MPSTTLRPAPRLARNIPGRRTSWSPHPICVDCAIQTEANPDERDRFACDGCGIVVDALAALTQFRAELGHLEGPLQLCERCSPRGFATYWTRDLDDRGLVRHKGNYWALGEADDVVAYTSMVESTRAANGRFGEEDMDEWLEHAVDDEETE